jgi:EAL domain-containing protein (putative c-di-GMP-specific phosphodiesterase class I)
MEEAAARIAELRSLGVKVAISEVGDEYCPVFRLTTLAFDYAFLDRYATDSLLGDGAERIAGSLVGFLHYLKVKVVAPLLETEEQCAAAEAVGCDGYTVGADFATEEVSADG